MSVSIRRGLVRQWEVEDVKVWKESWRDVGMGVLKWLCQCVGVI